MIIFLGSIVSLLLAESASTISAVFASAVATFILVCLFFISALKYTFQALDKNSVTRSNALTGLCADTVVKKYGSIYCDALTAGGMFSIALFVGEVLLFFYICYILVKNRGSFPRSEGLQNLAYALLFSGMVRSFSVSRSADEPPSLSGRLLHLGDGYGAAGDDE